MIKPTVGRIVWYHPADADPTPKFRGEVLAAIVARVISDHEVNLAVFRADGLMYGRHNVRLVQDGEIPPGACGWMPYQKGQAAKAEQLQQAADFARREPMPLA